MAPRAGCNVAAMQVEMCDSTATVGCRGKVRTLAGLSRSLQAEAVGRKIIGSFFSCSPGSRLTQVCRLVEALVV